MPRYHVGREQRTWGCGGDIEHHVPSFPAALPPDWSIVTTGYTPFRAALEPTRVVSQGMERAADCAHVRSLPRPQRGNCVPYRPASGLIYTFLATVAQKKRSLTWNFGILSPSILREGNK